MPDLHARLLAELDRLQQLAEAATPWVAYPSEAVPHEIQYGDFGPGIVGTTMGEWEDSEQGRCDAAFVRSVANPADALRRYAAARRVLNRHRRVSHGVRYGRRGACATCRGASGWNVGWPCPDIEDLAASLGIEVRA